MKKTLIAGMLVLGLVAVGCDDGDEATEAPPAVEVDDAADAVEQDVEEAADEVEQEAETKADEIEESADEAERDLEEKADEVEASLRADE